MMTTADLIAFEAAIADDFNNGRIRAPIHLSGNNEQQLIDYFSQNYDVQRGDWVFTTWRSHYHALLAGVSPERLRADILAGHSITLTYPDHNIVSSAIVGGILPIALGVALSIERTAEANSAFPHPEQKFWYEPTARVHVFLGDMTARTGIFWECLNYAQGHDLPIHFIIEDNSMSVMTTTEEAWGPNDSESAIEHEGLYAGYVTAYRYSLPWPHAGAGKRVMF